MEAAVLVAGNPMPSKNFGSEGRTSGEYKIAIPICRQRG
jgi:hypothetical protein